jgi:hypothetical protein
VPGFFIGIDELGIEGFARARIFRILRHRQHYTNSLRAFHNLRVRDNVAVGQINARGRAN